MFVGVRVYMSVYEGVWMYGVVEGEETKRKERKEDNKIVSLYVYLSVS